MSKETFLAQAFTAHVPDLDKKPGMVCQLWEDGEVTLQKCGELMHRRGLHMIQSGKSVSVPVEAMPVQMYGHGCVFVEDYNHAEEIARELDKV